MISTFIEATDGTEFNWGKFMVARFTPEEYAHPSAIDTGQRLLRAIGHGPDDVLVVDLQTCEGAIFTPNRHALASADLNKHRVWVCPMFEPFLAWLYQQDLTDLGKLPVLVNLGNVPTSMQGYRRSGGVAATVDKPPMPHAPQRNETPVPTRKPRPLTSRNPRPLARDRPEK